MATDFTKLLSKQAETIERPKPLPTGTYLVSNPTMPQFKDIGENKTPCAEFSFVVLAPQEDVDSDDLAAYGDVKGKTVRHRMFLTEASEFRTKEEILKVFAIEEAGKNLGQIFAETAGKTLLMKIKHTPTQDGTDMRHEVEELAAA